MRAPSLTTDRSSAEIADYLLLQAINRAEALLAHLSESGILHPEDPVGSEALELDVRVEGFEPGDRYLLCSDGLTRVLTDRVLAQMLSVEKNPELCARRLLFVATQAHADDNVTVIVIDA
jgi:serine/threonine protein phosphatase PrpC